MPAAIVGCRRGQKSNESGSISRLTTGCASSGSESNDRYSGARFGGCVHCGTVRHARKMKSHSEPHWYLTKDGDVSCLALYRRHYSCYNRHPKQGQFVGPGEHIVLRTDDGDAVFVWRFAEYRADGQTGVECSLFRNEGPLRSSELIRQADAVADHCWPGEGHYTFVDPQAVRSANPGFCFLAAGWRKCGRTKGGLIVLERVAPAVRTE